MAKSKRLFVAFMGLLLSLGLMMEANTTVQAGGNMNNLDSLSGGVAALLQFGDNVPEILNATVVTLTEAKEVEEESTLVMANVRDALNIRAEASEESEKVGKLYKDCGGTILERANGWSKIKSGNVVGWAKDEYLLFREDAKALANDVGRMVATIEADALRVRKAPNAEAEIYGYYPKGEIVEVLFINEEEWVCIDYEGQDGYVSLEFVKIDFNIDEGETTEEIKAREAAEQEAKRNINYGEYTTDADTTLLLAALIQCEAGGEGYEGQVAVGAVVLNRVRSGAYPNTVHGVIYASGQFTPALNGKLNKVLESGKIYTSCITAAEEVLSGVSNIGDRTHFRRNNGRDGIVIGNHVFY